MTIPVPGVRDIIDILDLTKSWFSRRRKQADLQAWRIARFSGVCNFLNEYYEYYGVPLFSYPHATGNPFKVPLYVRTEWQNLTDQQLDMHYDPEDLPYTPNRAQQDFLTFYQELRESLGMRPIWDGRIFRLTDLQTFSNRTSLKFTPGSFFHSMMCHYILEHELVTHLAKISASNRLKLDIRDRIAGSSQAIEAFCRYNVCRVGVSNLLILRSDDNTYIPIIQRRGSMSLGKGLDPVSSGIFEVITKPKSDFELKHKVLIEIYEELFGNADVITETNLMNPYFFYGQDGIVDLIKLLDEDSATFQVTGICIDLIRLVPEITTVLVVRDKSYYDRHMKGEGSLFKLNLEYITTSDLRIHTSLQDVDNYLANDILRDPDGSERGFDPMNWTLPGGFCFYQGLKRAVTEKLL